jgi:hypothetical protein
VTSLSILFSEAHYFQGASPAGFHYDDLVTALLPSPNSRLTQEGLKNEINNLPLTTLISLMSALWTKIIIFEF